MLFFFIAPVVDYFVQKPGAMNTTIDADLHTTLGDGRPTDFRVHDFARLYYRHTSESGEAILDGLAYNRGRRALTGARDRRAGSSLRRPPRSSLHPQPREHHRRPDRRRHHRTKIAVRLASFTSLRNATTSSAADVATREAQVFQTARRGS